MSWLQILIRVIMCFALFAAPIVASAMPHHETSTSVIRVNGEISSENRGQQDDCHEISKSAHIETSSDNSQTEKDSDDCCVASCAKHLTALPLNSVAFVSVRSRSQAVPQGKLVSNGRDIDPDRKPPRI